MRMLYSTWDKQRSAITQADLVRAASSGSLSPAVISKWQGQYADFVNNRLAPQWRAGASTAATFIEDQLQLNFPGYQPRFPNVLARIDAWIKQRGGSLITDLTDSQRQAINSILRHYTVDVPLSASELEKVIRPVVGLDARQTAAVQKRRDDLIEAGFTPLKATAQAARYAATLHRVRANRIARTELATAFNQGHLSTINQGIDDGDLLPDVEKKWLTSEDERVCSVCGPLNRTHKDVRGDDTMFTSGGRSVEVPPIHPSCRCTVIYVVDTDAQLELTEQQQEQEPQDLMLSDEELRDFDSTRYGALGGEPERYILAPPKGDIWKINNLNFFMVDIYDGVTGTEGVQKLEYDKLIGQTLESGINYQKISASTGVDVVSFSANIKNMTDLLTLPNMRIVNYSSDGTNTMLNLITTFAEPFFLVGNFDDRLIITINDDLRSMIHLRASAYCRRLLGKYENLENIIRHNTKEFEGY